MSEKAETGHDSALGEVAGDAPTQEKQYLGTSVVGEVHNHDVAEEERHAEADAGGEKEPPESEPRGERRSGHDRRSPFWFLKAEGWHAAYRRIFFLKLIPTFIPKEVQVPEPAINFKDSPARLEVLLSLHNQIRDAIQRWEDRIFQTFLISEGAVLSSVVFYVEHKKDLRDNGGIFAAAVIFFGIAAGVYLYLAARARAKNGIVIAKVEAALGLCQPDIYVRNDRFFGYSGYWEADWRTPVLLVIHIILVYGAARTILTY